jgi:lipoprotein-releasing system permease protein
MALVCTLSVFNGFRDLVGSSFTAFDPPLKVVPAHGKVFRAAEVPLGQLSALPDVEVVTRELEENAMVQYKEKQAMVVIKGVDDSFRQLTPIDSILYGRGELVLHDEVVEYGVMGIQLVSVLGSGISFVDPLTVYAPKRNGQVNLANPSSGFNSDYLFSPGVVFAVNQQKYDGSYILTSLNFARRLFDYDDELSSIGIKLKEGADLSRSKKQIETLLGEDFCVYDRYQQQADIFRVMEIEKLISYAFLTFILIIACFNVIGSLSMLILDKKQDVRTLRNLGANARLIERIFLFEGWLITLCGALAGILLGLLLCWAQIRFGLLRLGSSADSFIVDAYPVRVELFDVLLIFVTVVVVGLLSVWYPVRYLSRRLL